MPSIEENNKNFADILENKKSALSIVKEGRYDYNYVANNPSTQRYLLPFLKSNIKPTDKVLDYGCGSGITTRMISEFSSQSIGTDISPEFISKANKLLQAGGGGGIRDK
ncbi:MAG: class I SAM-dependent methyltransferase, partial [Ignavibacteria bacterium]|nr:class I SAM-dependent methyltransferase [Ignavibacteria bacterium]